jgi:O-acetyl-ADP-ribose deacetylase
VIHGAVMGQDLQTTPELIRRTTSRCLELADELGLESLALPAFGTGVGGFPLDEWARIMVAAAREHDARTLRRVVFAVFGSEARVAFERALE